MFPSDLHVAFGGCIRSGVGVEDEKRGAALLACRFYSCYFQPRGRFHPLVNFVFNSLKTFFVVIPVLGIGEKDLDLLVHLQLLSLSAFVPHGLYHEFTEYLDPL
ncbi:MAG: hypothetical protein JWO50_670 [Candidatus Kaiserbacteria bacterium]|nr:hypothetical protein [Candidatus Kaiserbacteria bacterium]